MEAGAVPTPLPKPSRDDRDDVVILRDTPWALYEAILAARGGKRVPRLQYASGRLELMSPGRSHERIHTLFGRFVEAYADECDIALDGYGSWTLKDEAVARGVEADECYVLGDPEGDGYAGWRTRGGAVVLSARRGASGGARRRRAPGGSRRRRRAGPRGRGG